MVNRTQSEIDADRLYYHGTARWQPTANTIYETARADRLKLSQNARIKSDKRLAKEAGAQARHQGSTSTIAFIAAHVRGASATSDVLRAAIKGVSDGQKSKRAETRYLYQSIGHLQRALQIAEAKGD